GANPSVRDLLVGVNASMAKTVYLLPNDPNVALAAREVPALTEKTVVIVPTADPVAVLAVLLRLGGIDEPVSLESLAPTLAGVHSASVFFAGKDASVGGTVVQKGTPAAAIGKRLIAAASLGEVMVDAVGEIGGAEGGLVTLYYGNAQKERDAQKYAAEIGERFADVDVEYYYGGQSSVEYWISLER
ncbi:MAG: dihydroxyacetone kinase, partial [Candidatus Eremiobacteraeota bacterium]|nr:dihydroxyacetone kinase [Candidatus Eremiobacteraeota bacterium]